MFTYVFCDSGGKIKAVCRRSELPKVKELDMNTLDGGFFIDLTGKDNFDSLSIMDICNGYKSDPLKKKLVKL